MDFYKGDKYFKKTMTEVDGFLMKLGWLRVIGASEIISLLLQ